MCNDTLMEALGRVFALPQRRTPESSMAWRYGNVQFHIETALRTLLRYDIALVVARALNDYVDAELSALEAARTDPPEGEKT